MKEHILDFMPSLSSTLSRRDALSLLATAPLACGMPFLSQQAMAADIDNVAAMATAKGLFLGTAVMAQPLRRDARYRALLEQTCNFYVHASALQWHELQRTIDSPYNFADADAIAAWCGNKGLPGRGHMLIDWNRLPAGADAAIMSATPKEAEVLLRRHVGKLAHHFSGRFLQWNVVNEPVSGPVMRPMSWYKKLGENYLDIAFDVAAREDPRAGLTINQVMVEMDDRHQQRNRDSFVALARRMLDRGLKLHSVGLEGHLISGQAIAQDAIDRMAKELASMGLGFFISELDVDDRQFDVDPAKRDAATASLTRDFLDVTLSQPNCLGLVCWGLDDRYNWIPLTGQNARPDGHRQRPAPFDMDFRPKPMWTEIVNAIKKAPGPGAMSIMPRR